MALADGIIVIYDVEKLSCALFFSFGFSAQAQWDTAKMDMSCPELLKSHLIGIQSQQKVTVVIDAMLSFSRGSRAGLLGRLLFSTFQKSSISLFGIIK